MPHFTLITSVRDSTELIQVEAENVEDALRQAIGRLPYDDGAGPADEELDWLQDVANGKTRVTMLPVKQCKNTWLWAEGGRYVPPYFTYAVQTEIDGAK